MEKKIKKIETLEDLLKMVKNTFLEDFIVAMMKGEYCDVEKREIPPGAEYIGDMMIPEMALLTVIEKIKTEMRGIIDETNLFRIYSPQEMKKLGELRFEADVLDRMLWLIEKNRFADLMRISKPFGFIYAGRDEVFMDEIPQQFISGLGLGKYGLSPDKVVESACDMKIAAMYKTPMGESIEQISLSEEEKLELMATLCDILDRRLQK